MRKLRADEVTFTLKIEPEEMCVRGNALASDDPELDRALEDEIIARLDAGDLWAWCCVIVEAHWRGFVGGDSLGGCCYADEKDFKAGGYFDDMQTTALDALQAAVERAVAEGAKIEAALADETRLCASCGAGATHVEGYCSEECRDGARDLGYGKEA